jgi:hypothetical protein
MTGTPVSSWTRMRPWETASEMYSKCIVSPLISTPIAITASKGWEGMVATTAGGGFAVEDAGAGVVVREGKGELKLRPPRRSVAVAPAWTREPVITLPKEKPQVFIWLRWVMV